MKSSTSGFIAAAMLCAVLTAPALAADDPSKDAKIAELESRIAELESQNRAILEALSELRGRLPAEVVESRPPASTSAAETLLPNQVQLGNSRLGFYGFVRVDAIYDDSRPSSIQSPIFVQPEDASLGTEESEDSFNFHPRLTRFGMSYDGPQVGEKGKLTGKIEIDFQNGGRESRAIPRMRHAYLNLDWGMTSLLAGQTWDLISPLYPTVNADTLMWNAGNLGDRRPQVRLKVEGESGLTFEGGIGVTGAINDQDLDGDGVRDGDDSALPNFQARVGYAGERFAVGLSGHLGSEETRRPVAGKTDFDSSSLNLDFKATLGRVKLQGEVWTGENLSDFRGGIGQGVNTATGEEIGSAGGWFELGVELSGSHSLFVGYSIDDPTDDDVPTGGRIKNDAWFLVNQFRLGRAFKVGIDYLYWTTRWKGLEEGTDNRFNLYLIYNF